MNKGNALPGQGLTLAAFLASVLFLGAGLIWLLASVGTASRLPAALVLLLIGGVLAGWAGLRWRRRRLLSPGVLDVRITALADANDAELSLAQVVSALDVPDDAARAALARLEGEGLCLQEQRGGKTVYVFPGLRESKVIRRCSYCGSEYSVREPLHKCANCGGDLELVKT